MGIETGMALVTTGTILIGTGFTEIITASPGNQQINKGSSRNNNRKNGIKKEKKQERKCLVINFCRT